eukprot:scaffold474507_cov33-Prasinocladus_malaysianus.AAC.1
MDAMDAEDYQQDCKRRCSFGRSGWLEQSKRTQVSQSWGPAAEEAMRGTPTPARAGFSRVCDLLPGDHASVSRSTRHVIQEMA